MEAILDAMKKEGDRMIEELEYLQNFDFEDTTPEELDKFQLFLKQRMDRNDKVKANMDKLLGDMKQRK